MWLTSDTHFGHANIIRYCDRPFAAAQPMDGALVDAWNDRVRPDDEVWHLGDVALGRLDETLGVVTRLHGRKFLVPGNHDRCWPGHREAGAWSRRYTDAGFGLLPETTTLDVAGTPAVVCHFPYVGDSHGADRHVEHRPEDRGGWLLHGHVHDAWRQRGRMINVGVDVWDYAPVHLDTVADLVAAGPRELDRYGVPLRMAG